MTTRRWMVAVAVVGLLLGIGASGLRSLKYSRTASAHLNRFTWIYLTLPHRGMAETMRLRRKAKYHLGLYDKYKAAARRPWLPVEPDPPAPE